jgi:hypothetical protein
MLVAAERQAERTTSFSRRPDCRSNSATSSEEIGSGRPPGGLQDQGAGQAVAGKMDNVPAVTFLKRVTQALPGDAVLQHAQLDREAGTTR